MFARTQEADGVESYEGLLRERVYLGLAGLRFRRERSLFQSERVARIRWDENEGRTIQWLGVKNEAPMFGEGAGVSWGRGEGEDGEGHVSLSLSDGAADVSEDEQHQLQAALLDNLNPLIFTYRPGDDRLAFGNRFALHPLADSAALHYRYRSGDTLRVALPGENRDITLIEIQVEPRRAAFELLAGSLWFDAESGDLVRAHYRPSRPYDLAVDEDEDVLGIFSPFRVDIEYLTVEYSLQESRWWMPRRFGVRGEVRAGRLLRAPLAVEWSVGEYLVNTEESLIPGEDALPPGWAAASGTWEDGEGRKEAVRVLAPPVDSLRNSSFLSGELLGPSLLAFSDDEIQDIRSDLEALMPAQEFFGSGLSYGLADRNVRYNRVEGLSIGASSELGIGRNTWLEPRVRFGLLDQEFRGSLALHRGVAGDRLSVTGYRRLAHTDDFGDPLSLGASLSNLVFRNGHSHFFNATGLEMSLQKHGGSVRSEVRAFWEDHSAVERETNFYLWEPLTSDTLPSVLAARPGSIFGVAGDVRWEAGDDARRGIASGLLRGELADGDFQYQRLLGTVAANRRLALGLTGAVEFGAGYSWGELPTQKDFFLGGANSLRGYSGSFVHGSSFWMARGELATALPLARIAVFSDLGWSGPSEEWSRGQALWSAGAGLSFLDGLVRMDAAWPIRQASGGRFYLYLDGLF